MVAGTLKQFRYEEEAGGMLAGIARSHQLRQAGLAPAGAKRISGEGSRLPSRTAGRLKERGSETRSKVGGSGEALPCGGCVSLRRWLRVTDPRSGRSPVCAAVGVRAGAPAVGRHGWVGGAGCERRGSWRAGLRKAIPRCRRVQLCATV
jgi:hypothetical protein